MVLHFQRQALVATMRSCCWLQSHKLLEVLKLQISHLISCHVRAAGCYRDYATWFQTTNSHGMCEQWVATKLLIDCDCFKEGVTDTHNVKMIESMNGRKFSLGSMTRQVFRRKKIRLMQKLI